MITGDLLSPLNSIKKEAGTGSYKGMRWRIEKGPEGELKVTIYPEPKAFANTPDSEKESRNFDFSEEGKEQAAKWLWEQYELQKDRWQNAPKV